MAQPSFISFMFSVSQHIGPAIPVAHTEPSRRKNTLYAEPARREKNHAHGTVTYSRLDFTNTTCVAQSKTGRGWSMKRRTNEPKCKINGRAYALVDLIPHESEFQVSALSPVV
eukprot:1279690-Amphidinium_carterae.1